MSEAFRANSQSSELRWLYFVSQLVVLFEPWSTIHSGPGRKKYHAARILTKLFGNACQAGYIPSSPDTKLFQFLPCYHRILIHQLLVPFWNGKTFQRDTRGYCRCPTKQCDKYNQKQENCLVVNQPNQPINQLIKATDFSSAHPSFCQMANVENINSAPTINKVQMQTFARIGVLVFHRQSATLRTAPTYHHTSAVTRLKAVLQAALVVCVVYYPRQHCGKVEVMLCGLIIETAAPAFTGKKNRYQTLRTQ